ncbi:ABC transporter substrate-binding protein [Candidatus Halocynthiibacter alkanivorans]|uniref:ABC transporter substrate-binding protein n=1 Tax=Candidatus Halocynthiibacter alkanivorans TaxID=2267619 RepID=UPI000DF1EE84|nr:ABC transporter substrate-binding protein [Candidatus Halocynthiibacter alkanivorans]
MKLFTKTAVAALVLGLSASAVSAETFKWAGSTDPQTMDPHAVNSAPVLGFLNNVYEGLVRRNKEMKIEAALAESWEPLGSGGWRFHLRQGVTYHDGSAFTAEDVLFSYERASSEEADVRSWFSPVSEVIVQDEYTIDFMTKAPNPLFPDSIANFMIMDKGWTEGNDAARPAKDAENFATRNANGTGAFVLASRDPGVRTTLTPYSGWWDDLESNITEAVFTPIGEASTGMAALLSGEIDFIAPIPLQDVPRMKERAGFTVHEGVEARVIMFGFSHESDALKYSDETSDKNPFQDPRVRQAIYQAIDVDALTSRIMRGTAEPVSQLVSSEMKGFSEGLSDRLPLDRDAAKALLAEAGYPDGFSFGLMCPNDRYINDEAICRATASMLAKIGVTAKLSTMPVRNYWPQLREDNFDMYLLGWSPGTFDAEHPLRFLASTPNSEKKLGSWNFGGYSSARIDELLPMIQTEIDDGKRQAMIDEAHKILQDDVAYVPMFVQPLIWATRDNISLTQRTDNFFILRWVTVNG